MSVNPRVRLRSWMVVMLSRVHAPKMFVWRIPPGFEIVRPKPGYVQPHPFYMGISATAAYLPMPHVPFLLSLLSSLFPPPQGDGARMAKTTRRLVPVLRIPCGKPSGAIIMRPASMGIWRPSRRN